MNTIKARWAGLKQMVRSLAFLEDNIEHKADISEAAKRKPEKLLTDVAYF